MRIIETPNHLYQPPKFQSRNIFYDNFGDAFRNSGDTVTLDVAAIQSYLSFGYICSDRTLLSEVERQPWLSNIIDNKVVLSDIPPHGFFGDNFSSLADRFFELVVDEVRNAIRDYDQIYVLLSGGLDSRIGAGALKHLYKNGELKVQPIAVTWGLENSRDVVYAKKIAEKLNFGWMHVPLTPDTVMQNIEFTAKKFGLLHSPELLHSMLWFENLPENSLVIAGSFGDSIGRGEFSNLHLLQLRDPNPTDKFNILKSDARRFGTERVSEDIKCLFERSPHALDYAHNEHFMQGNRMRGGLCNALTAINGRSRVYQIFTDPSVYQFIWSLHPSVRGNEIYVKLFERHMPELSHFPWARTNKALGKSTDGAISGLKPHYHEYTKWSKNELRGELEALIDIDWFDELGLFNRDSLENLRKIVRTSEVRVGRANDIWLWLAGFRIFIDYVKNNKNLVLNLDYTQLSGNEETITIKESTILKNLNSKFLNKNESVNSITKSLRTYYRKYQTKKLKDQFLIKYPLVKLNDSSFL